MSREPGLYVSEFLDQLAPNAWRTKAVLSWPPDVFALAATVLQKSGAYTNLVKEWQFLRGRAWCDEVRRIGSDWRNACVEGTSVPEKVADLWAVVEQDAGVELTSTGRDENKRLCSALLELVAASDEACSGVGIPPLLDAFEGDATLLLKRRSTLCRLIDPSRVRVLPKLHAPRSGMTIRSISHHLALCPAGEVAPEWIYVRRDEMPTELNLLLLPWPTQVEPAQFQAMGRGRLGTMPDNMQFFSYVPKNEQNFATRLQAVFDEARRLVENVHVVVFPELSLTKGTHEIAREEVVVKRSAFLISGVCEGPSSESEYGLNYARLDIPATTPIKAVQNKHHRWQLDSDQINQYGLQESLDPNTLWWEHTAIGQRSLSFVSFAGWLTLCVLICEDLARQDPVSEMVRAVGPNLVIALLMDGPQLVERWSARYATVLADDPGCSVLTLSSLGMVQRSRAKDRPDAAPSRVIGLWKDAVLKKAEMLTLPEGADGIVLRLRAKSFQEFCADGRSDFGTSRYPILCGEPIAVRLPSGVSTTTS